MAVKIKTMRNTELKISKKNDSIGKYAIIGLSSITSLLIGYYLISRAFPFLNISEKIYGRYFFHRAYWVFPHVVFGILATIIGPFQFIPQLRNKYLAVHRKLGRIYIIATVLGGISGMYLATTSGISLSYSVGLFMLGVTWSASSIMAFVSIKNKKVELHKEWMIRSYILTFTFVSFRFLVDVLLSLNIGSQEDILTLMSWACWAIPLFIAELIMQGRKIKN